MNETLSPQETAPQPVINQAPPPQTTQEEEPPVSITEKKKKPILPIILSILLVLALGAAGYFAYMYYQPDIPGLTSTETTEPTPSPTPNSNPTTDWKTYSSEVHNVSFKYPNSWTIKEELSEYKCGPNEDVICNTKIFLSKNDATINFGLALDEYGGMGQNYEGVPYQIDGYKLFKYERIIPPDEKKTVRITDSLTKTLGVIYIDGIDYSIDIVYPSNYPQNKESSLLKEFDQILSTFKFPNSKENWITYKDTSLGLSFKYPKNQTVNSNQHNSTFGGKHTIISTTYNESGDFNWFIEENTKNKSLEYYIDYYSNKSKDVVYSNKSIGNLNGTLVETSGSVGQLDFDPAHFKYYFIGNNNSLNMIRLYTRRLEISEIGRQQFNAILETISLI